MFGSRFVRGGGVIDYPPHKLLINRLANLFLRMMFHVPLNDFTNAFKAYRRKAIDGCRPFLSPHFNLTIELPLKTIVRGYSWTVIPITWRNRRSGMSKLKIKEMGSRYCSSRSTAGWRNISAAGTIPRSYVAKTSLILLPWNRPCSVLSSRPYMLRWFSVCLAVVFLPDTPIHAGSGICRRTFQEKRIRPGHKTTPAHRNRGSEAPAGALSSCSLGCGKTRAMTRIEIS